MSNSLMILKPYWHEGFWVFDDPATGLNKEPFVAGVPEMLGILLERENIPDPQRGFRLLFSAVPFPGHQLKATWVRTDGGGNWYTAEGHEGWLCPALFKYFEEAPKELYIQVLPRMT